MKSSQNPQPHTGGACLSLVSTIHQGARDYQEDALGHWLDAGRKRLFAVVADGAGGHCDGAEASQAAIASADPAWATPEATTADPERFLTDWMAQAHTAVNEAAAKIHRSARSVVVACVTDGHTVHLVHAGDSRRPR